MTILWRIGRLGCALVRLVVRAVENALKENGDLLFSFSII